MATFADVTKLGLAQVNFDIAEYARSEHAKIMELDPRPDSFIRWVDGVEDAPEEAVKRVIVYEYNRLDLVAMRVLDTLRKNSPVRSGEYVRGHTLFLNSVEVQDLKSWRQGDEISITNYVPYSRKIEVGKMKMSVPGHVYEASARMMQRYFKDVADIAFTYRGIVAGHQIDQQKGKSIKGHKEHNKSAMRYPAIIILPAGTVQKRVHGR